MRSSGVRGLLVYCADYRWHPLDRKSESDMSKPDLEFDIDRYRKLLAEATDEKKRLALIELLIEERAMERLEAARCSERDATTAATIIRVLGR